MVRLRPSVIAALVCAGVLSACGGTSSTSSVARTPTSSAAPSRSASTSASPAPAPCTMFTSRKFTTAVPSGWTDKNNDAAEVAKFCASGQVLFLVEQGPPGLFQTNVNDVNANINVVALSTQVPDDQVAPYLTSVTNHGATNLSPPQPFTIDGSNGQYVVYNQEISGASGVTLGESQDMVINHGGITYDIVFNTSQFAFTKQLPGLQSVLAAWKWSS